MKTVLPTVLALLISSSVAHAGTTTNILKVGSTVPFLSGTLHTNSGSHGGCSYIYVSSDQDTYFVATPHIDPTPVTLDKKTYEATGTYDLRTSTCTLKMSS